MSKSIRKAMSHRLPSTGRAQAATSPTRPCTQRRTGSSHPQRLTAAPSPARGSCSFSLASLKARPLNLKNPRSSEAGGPDLENANSPRQGVPRGLAFETRECTISACKVPTPPLFLIAATPRRKSISNNAFPMLHPLANRRRRPCVDFPCQFHNMRLQLHQ